MNPERKRLFHGDDVPPSAPADALFHVIPVPLEQSVSYGTGTAEGPQAILEASSQLELLACGTVPAQYGIYTAPPVECSGPVEDVLQRIGTGVGTTLEQKKIPVIIGGEHTVTCGITTSLTNHYGAYGVIQFDAHADLRDTYQGSSLSHACVMRRIHEQGIPIYQLGTRSYSQEEEQYRLKHGILFRDALDLWQQTLEFELPPDFPEKVFITFDIDGLDSALMPATGTPAPGGLHWYQTMSLLQQIMETRICIGFDMVEYAPIPGFHGYSFTAAQLVYNMMGYLVRSAPNRRYHGIC